MAELEASGIAGVLPVVHTSSARARKRRYWNLLREVTISQYKLKDQNTFFGFLWSFFHPLIVVGILYVCFRSQVGRGIDHYPIYLLIGVVQFTHFANSTSGAMMVLYNMRQLTCNAILPKEVLVIGAVLAKTPELAISMGICVLIGFVAGLPIGWGLLLLPLVLAMQVLLVLCASLLLSALYVFVKDSAYVYQAFLRILFFITPTFYAADLVGNGAGRWLMRLNPLTHLIGFSRELIVGGVAISLPLIASLLLALGGLVWTALELFRRLEPRFAEYV